MLLILGLGKEAVDGRVPVGLAYAVVVAAAAAAACFDNIAVGCAVAAEILAVMAEEAVDSFDPRMMVAADPVAIVADNDQNIEIELPVHCPIAGYPSDNIADAHHLLLGDAAAFLCLVGLLFPMMCLLIRLTHCCYPISNLFLRW